MKRDFPIRTFPNAAAPRRCGTKRTERDEDESPVGQAYSSDSTRNAAKRQRTNKHKIAITDASPFLSTVSSPGSHPPGTHSTPPEAEPQYMHDPMYFFGDGDIILRTGRTLFCVHLKKLKAVKGFFEELFSLPQPEDAERVYGVICCDLLELMSPSDVHYIVGFIYGDLVLQKTVRGGCDWLFWDAAVALLSLGYKFNLPDLRSSAIKALKVLFPCSTEARRFRPVIGGIKTQREKKLHLRMFPIQAVNLFREYYIPALMPMAYYHAAQLSVDDIVNGVTRSDGVVEKLNAFDMMRVLQGRDHLKASRRTITFRWLNNLTIDGKSEPPSRECPDRPIRGGETCFFFLMRLYMDFNRSGIMDSRPDGIEPLPVFSRELVHSHLCDSCWAECSKKIIQGVQENWLKLPSYFGWNGWNDVILAQEKEEEAWAGNY